MWVTGAIYKENNGVFRTVERLLRLRLIRDTPRYGLLEIRLPEVFLLLAKIPISPRIRLPAQAPVRPTFRPSAVYLPLP